MALDRTAVPADDEGRRHEEESVPTTEVTTAGGGPASKRPFVVAHVAVSLDGATVGFPADIARFYKLIRTWHEDVTLTGADTVLAQETAMREGDHPGPARDGPLLAVVDSRARVHEWEALRTAGYWSDVVALGAEATPERFEPVDEIVGGVDRVDLAAALDTLARRGARVVRVDSGGALIGALLHDGLVDEVSLLVHPSLTGHPERLWHGRAALDSVKLRLTHVEAFDDLVWLRYRLTDLVLPPG